MYLGQDKLNRHLLNGAKISSSFESFSQVSNIEEGFQEE